MLSPKVKWAIYLVVNAVVGWVVRTLIYIAIFARDPWDWAKWGWVIVLYLAVGFLVSLSLSLAMWFWKHWNWANGLIYRPVTAVLGATVLWLQFAVEIVSNPTAVQTWVSTGIAAISVVGIGALLMLTARDAFQRKVAKDFING